MPVDVRGRGHALTGTSLLAKRRADVEQDGEPFVRGLRGIAVLARAWLVFGSGSPRRRMSGEDGEPSAVHRPSGVRVGRDKGRRSGGTYRPAVSATAPQVDVEHGASTAFVRNPYAPESCPAEGSSAPCSTLTKPTNRSARTQIEHSSTSVLLTEASTERNAFTSESGRGRLDRRGGGRPLGAVPPSLGLSRERVPIYVPGRRQSCVTIGSSRSAWRHAQTAIATDEAQQPDNGLPGRVRGGREAVARALRSRLPRPYAHAHRGSVTPADPATDSRFTHAASLAAQFRPVCSLIERRTRPMLRVTQAPRATTCRPQPPDEPRGLLCAA